MADATQPADYRQRYRALSDLAISAAAGESPSALLEMAVSEAVASVGLAAGAVRIFGPREKDVAGAMAGQTEARTRLHELETTLLAQLRRNYSVRSLFMTLDLGGPAGLFSYPLKSGDVVIGAISGIARGERSLAAEEHFVSSLAAMIVLIGQGGRTWAAGEAKPSDAGPGRGESAIRTEAVKETAAAINHEINNPLMAVMGNVELLLRKDTDLDPDAREKLRKIYDAAARIRQVTQNLMRISEAQSTPYPGGSSMIDIDGSPKEPDKS